MKKKIASVARKNKDRKLKPRGKYQSVSKALGLDRLEKATPKTCRDRANEIEKKLRLGRVPKKLRDKAVAWIRTYRARARSLAS